MKNTFLIQFFCLLFSVQLFGHGDLDDQIKNATENIKQEPTDANLYLKRGQLYAQHEAFNPARLDYLQARFLDQNLFITDLLMAQLYAQHNQLDTALIYANTFLKQHPNHSDAFIARAGIYQQSGFPDSCQQDLERAMENLKDPNPGHFMAIADAVLCSDATNYEAALYWLKKGEESLGFDIVIKTKEIDIYLKARQYEQVIQTIDYIMEQFPRKEKWLFQKAIVYEKIGDTGLAQNYYNDTLNAIQQLPKRLQTTKKILELEVQTLENLALLTK